MSNKRRLSAAGGTADDAADDDSQDGAGQVLTEGVFEKGSLTPEPGKKKKKIDPVRTPNYCNHLLSESNRFFVFATGAVHWSKTARL